MYDALMDGWTGGRMVQLVDACDEFTMCLMRVDAFLGFPCVCCLPAMGLAIER